MRIGILTLPLHINYGGILQAYALQTVLERIGHQVYIINLQKLNKKRVGYIQYCITEGKLFLKRILDKSTIRNYEYDTIRQHKIKPFIKKNIHHLTKKVYNNQEFINIVKNNNYDAIIVGSDQVWRKWGPEFASLNTFYLDGLENYPIRKIAYGVSFGKDDVDYTNDEIKRCKELVKFFSAISVREKQGKSLCKSILDVEAVQVLDPTLLLEKEEYLTFIHDVIKENGQKGLYYYILDKDEKKLEFLSSYAKEYNMKPYEQMPVMRRKDYSISINYEDYIYPSVEKWLSGFYEADVVITDSFHGTVFSILFNKPFIVLGNSERGFSRFESLLSLLGLESRIALNNSLAEIERLHNDRIDWISVNNKREMLKNESIEFLKYYLS